MILSTSASTKRSPLKYLVLLFTLSIPFWVAGAIFDNTGFLPTGMPVSALMFLCPVMAASILTYRHEGRRGIGRLLKRTFSLRGLKHRRVWWVLLVPATMLLTYSLMPLSGVPLSGLHTPLLTALVLFAVFFISASAEEAGWMGYAADPLQARWGALGAGVILGVAWAVWHVLPLIQAHRSTLWIAGWFLGTVAARILIVWLFNNTGKSVVAASTFHGLMSFAQQVFPNFYLHPAPAIVFGTALAIEAVIVTFLWGPRTLMQYRRRAYIAGSPHVGQSAPHAGAPGGVSKAPAARQTTTASATRPSPLLNKLLPDRATGLTPTHRPVIKKRGRTRTR